MPSQSSGCRLVRLESKASELNTKFESDYIDCMDILEREKQRGPSTDDRMSITDSVPKVIIASRDAATQRKMLLRTKSRCSSGATRTTNKMFLASRENGIIITSNRQVPESPRSFRKEYPEQHPFADTADESTLWTFSTVGAKIILREEEIKENTSPPVPRESVERTSLLKPVSFDVNSKMHCARESVQDRENRKRLHYKDKLRELTHKLTTSDSIVRSKEVISTIVERGRAVGNEVLNDANSNMLEENVTAGKKVLNRIKDRFYACGLYLCVDEATIDHEGLIIAVPERGLQCSCTEDTESTAYDDEFEECTAVSSLTGLTHHRFQARLWR